VDIAALYNKTCAIVNNFGSSLNHDSQIVALALAALDWDGPTSGYVSTTLMPLLTDSPYGLCAIMLAASEMEAAVAGASLRFASLG
jgi:hypothetical protein